MANIDFPQQRQAERADLSGEKIDQAMALCNRINDEGGAGSSHGVGRPEHNLSGADAFYACAAFHQDTLNSPDSNEMFTCAAMQPGAESAGPESKFSLCASIISGDKEQPREMNLCAAVISEQHDPLHEINACAAIVDGGALDRRAGSKSTDLPEPGAKGNDAVGQGLGARKDELCTGDTVIHANGKMEVLMPSGEYLQVDGKQGWQLMDANGNLLADNRTGSGKLPDGAELEHVVPFMGPGWTVLSYANGDAVTIDKNGVNLERKDKLVSIPLEPRRPTVEQRHSIQ